MSRILNQYKFNLLTKLDAFPYQTQAFLAIKDLDYCAIFHEQGLGKTKIAIDLLMYWLKQREIDTVMIVTKKQLVANWVGEFSIHTYIKPKIIGSNKSDNFYVLNSPCKVIITNFETLSTDKDRIKLFLSCRNVAIIIDESTKIKNPKSKLTQDYFELANLFKIRTIMTGTPVANRPYDIWAQIYFLDNGGSLGDNFEEFKRGTDLTNELVHNEEERINFENETSKIFDKISAFTVRETKNSGIINLPQKEYKTIYAHFEEEQKEMYKKIIEDLEIEVTKNNEKQIDDESVSLKRLIRLNQVTSNPHLIDDLYNNKSGKEIELEKIILEIVEKNEKCIVWTSFIDNVDYFHKKFKKYNPVKIHGSLSMEERNKSVVSFKNNNDCKILFATPQAAKEGLTLTIANHVIFYDRGFNLDDYLQAQDRIHRISQTKTCYVYNVMIEESIDEWIDRLLEAKQYAAFLAQGDMNLEEYQKNINYSYSEIVNEILSFGRGFND